MLRTMVQFPRTMAGIDDMSQVNVVLIDLVLEYVECSTFLGIYYYLSVY